MAGYRQFHTIFWKDSWVIGLKPVERYLYIYLFTNEQSSISGIFELPMKIIKNETELDEDFICETLQKFQDANKIFYKDNIMWVVKMRKHHANMSPTTMTRVNADVAILPDCDVKKAYLYYQETGKYCTDTVSMGYSYHALKDEDKDEDKAGETTPSAFVTHAEQIYSQVTNFTGLPSSDYKEILRRFADLERVGKMTQEYLNPYFREMRRRYPRSLRTFWIDWALAGEIPPESKNGKEGAPKQKAGGIGSLI